MNNGRAIDVETIRKQAEANRAYLVELISTLVKFRSYFGEAEEIQRFLQE